jgi:Flp pilus assembly pilin Flp
MFESAMNSYRSALAGLTCKFARLRQREDGQGTTEYAILVGVLVVIAILAITVFRPKLQELWDAIANGINSL